MDPSELLVGFLDAERAGVAAGGAPWTAADLTAQAVGFHAARGLAAVPPTVTETQLAAIRARMAELFARWDALDAGGVLELHFDPAPVAAVDQRSAGRTGHAR
jgi:hypothetical protein